MNDQWTLINTRTHQTLADQAHTACSYGSRLKGLLGVRELPVGQGLRIDRCNAIHTFFMKIPLDVVFVDSGLRVVRRIEKVPAFRVCWGGWKARAVIELPAGTIGRTGTEAGDILECQPN